MLATEKRVEFKLRPGTQDAQVFREVVAENQYLLPEKFEPEDIIIDIGAHIGAFALACHCRGAGEVWCFEPDKDNFQILKENLAPWSNATAFFRKAVWRSDREERPTFSGYADGYTACGSVLPHVLVSGTNHFIKVEVTSLDGMLEAATQGATKRIRLLKIDAEGSEYPVLYTSKLLGYVDEIVGECHDVHMHGLAEHVPIDGFKPKDFTMRGMMRFLESKGFWVEWQRESNENEINSIFWAKRK